MQKDVDTFWAWVETRMDEVGIRSFRELENKSGFAPGAIGKRKNALKLPTVEMALGMGRALRVNWDELWSHTKLASEPEETITSRELVYMFMQLNDEDQERILDITRTFLEKKERVIIGGEKSTANT